MTVFIWPLFSERGAYAPSSELNSESGRHVAIRTLSFKGARSSARRVAPSSRLLPAAGARKRLRLRDDWGEKRDSNNKKIQPRVAVTHSLFNRRS